MAVYIIYKLIIWDIYIHIYSSQAQQHVSRIIYRSEEEGVELIIVSR